MKKHFTFLWVAILWLLPELSGTLYGQIDPTTSRTYNPIPPVYQFVRYGNTPVHLNTGLISFEIPIFTYSDPDFTIPVSLSYISEGFKPQSLPGILGMNWFLNAGGMITREIKGAADDLHQTEQYAQSVLDGYNSTLPHITGFLKRRDHPETMYMEDDFDSKNHPHCLTSEVHTPTGQSSNIFKGFGSVVISEKDHSYVIETESDLYHFNFMGFKGTFIIDGQLNARVINCDNAGTYKIDLSRVSIRNWSPQKPPTRPDTSYITILTGDGYKYVFGGLLDYIDYTGNYTSDGGISSNWAITSWKLNNIIAPNGRTVKFRYFSENNLPKKDHEFTSGCHILNTVRSFQTGYEIIPGTEFPNDNPPKRRNISTWNATTLLTGITVDGQPVFELTYTEDNDITESARLKDIIVKNNEMDLLNISLDYEKYESSQINNTITGRQETFPRYWLTAIHSSREGTYSFSYYHPGESYPHYLTTSIDHWGYWNVIYDYDFQDLVPDKTGIDYQDEYGDVHINERGRRAPYPGAGKYGLLKQIVYPTGGSTNFAYEDHQYSKRLDRLSRNNFLPALENISGIAGGARIKRITDCDSIPGSPVRSREYFYVDNPAHINSTGNSPEQSSGILLSWPRYFYKLIATYEGNVREYIRQLKSTTLLEFSYGNQHIEYGKVFEKHTNGAIAEYHYSTYTDSPDVPAIPFMHPDSMIVITDPADILNTLLNPMTSRKETRGLLKCKINYDADGRKLTEEDYTYNSIQQYNLSAVYNSHFLSRRLLTLSDYYYKYSQDQRNIYLGKNIKYNYLTYPFSPVTTIEEFVHNLSGQLKESFKINSNGDKYGTLYKYISDLSDPITDPVYKLMKDSNVINNPIETIQYLIKNDSSDTLIISASRPAFAYIPGAGIKQTSHKIYNPQNPIPFSQYQGNPETYLDTEAEYLYTASGKIKQVTRRDGSVVSYLWGYNGMYPVAVINGIKYKDLSIPPSYKENSYDSGLYESVGKQLRILNPQGQISTFTFIPSVGLLSETDPAGRTVRYTYEPVTNRLLRETDMDGNVVKSYQYNIINQ